VKLTSSWFCAKRRFKLRAAAAAGGKCQLCALTCINHPRRSDALFAVAALVGQALLALLQHAHGRADEGIGAAGDGAEHDERPQPRAQRAAARQRERGRQLHRLARLPSVGVGEVGMEVWGEGSKAACCALNAASPPAVPPSGLAQPEPVPPLHVRNTSSPIHPASAFL
jgi:hypothetical protein